MIPSKGFLPDERYELPRLALMKAILRPRNYLGLLLGYGTCGCGNTWWQGKDSPGYAYSQGSANLLCHDCYERNKGWLWEHNHRTESRPMDYGNGRIGYLICDDEDCPVHREMDNFEWKNRQWVLRG